MLICPTGLGGFGFFQVLVRLTGPGGFGLVLPRPTGLEGVWIFFKYWFAQRVWGFHFFFSSTGLPNGPGQVWLSTASPNGSGGRLDFFQALVRPTGLAHMCRLITALGQQPRLGQEYPKEIVLLLLQWLPWVLFFTLSWSRFLLWLARVWITSTFVHPHNRNLPKPLTSSRLH